MIYDNPFELGVVIFRQIHISMDCFKKKLMVCTIHRGGFLQMFPKKTLEELALWCGNAAEQRAECSTVQHFCKWALALPGWPVETGKLPIQVCLEIMKLFFWNLKFDPTKVNPNCLSWSCFFPGLKPGTQSWSHWFDRTSSVPSELILDRSHLREPSRRVGAFRCQSPCVAVPSARHVWLQ